MNAINVQIQQEDNNDDREEGIFSERDLEARKELKDEKKSSYNWCKCFAILLLNLILGAIIYLIFLYMQGSSPFFHGSNEGEMDDFGVNEEETVFPSSTIPNVSEADLQELYSQISEIEIVKPDRVFPSQEYMNGLNEQRLQSHDWLNMNYKQYNNTGPLVGLQMVFDNGVETPWMESSDVSEDFSIEITQARIPDISSVRYISMLMN